MTSQPSTSSKQPVLSTLLAGALPRRCAGVVPPPPRLAFRSVRQSAATVATPRKAAESPWHRIRVATSGSVSRIHDWLADHCEGRWHVGVTGCDRYLATKFAEIHFECVADKRRFKAVFATRSAMAI